MSYTYAGNPAASKVDEVHYRLGDVDASNPISTDEECAFALCEHGGNAYLAAAALAETKGMEFLYKPSIRRGDRWVTYTDRANHFLTLARQLRNNASMATTNIYVGGQSESEKKADRHSLDQVQPYMRTTLHQTRPWYSWEDMEREP